MSSFQSCSNITNVFFSPESSGISFPANAFRCRAKLTQPLILYGATNVASSAFDNWQIPSITFDKGIRGIGTLTNVTMLAEVRFLGGPPSSPATFANYGIPPKTGTITTYVPYKYRQQWWPYADGYDPEMSDAQKESLIRLTGTTFSSTYATTPAKRPLLLADMPDGLVIIFR